MGVLKRCSLRQVAVTKWVQMIASSTRTSAQRVEMLVFQMVVWDVKERLWSETPGEQNAPWHASGGRAVCGTVTT